MRFLAIGIASLVLLTPSVVFAESGEELRARGEQLAKDGRFTEAIDAFKAAERIEPRARHACLIALAYTRRELWPQAEIFLEECERRATAADPLPEWVPTAKQQLAERIATVNVAPVTLKVEPPGVEVKLAVSSFAPDELFAPRTIHLPPGRHVVIATAKGYNDAQKTIDVGGDKAPQDVVITMLPIGTSTGPTGPGAPLPAGPTTTAPASKVPLALMITGGALLGGGLVVWGTAWRSARNDMLAANEAGRSATDQDGRDAAEEAYDDAGTRFDRYRALSIGLYAAGAITVGVGVALKLTKYKTREAPSVAILPTGDGGGMVSVGWMR